MRSTSMGARAQLMREYRLVVVGDGGVGKSALTTRFIQDIFIEDYDPTIEDSYRKQCVLDSEVVILDILDTAGQEAYRAMQDQYFRSGDGFVLVYSITSHDSFDAIHDFYADILRVKDADYFPMVLVANKCDLEYERSVGRRDGRELAKIYGLHLIETSAKLNINVEETFFTLAREIKRYNKELATSRYGLSPRTPLIASHEIGDGEHESECTGCVVL